MDIPNLSPEDKAKKLAEIQAKMAAAKAAKMAIGGSPSAATPNPTSVVSETKKVVAKPVPDTEAGKIVAIRKKVDEQSFKYAEQKARQQELEKIAFDTNKQNKKAADKKEPEVGAWYFGRRNFLQSTGWLSFFGFFTIMLLGSIRSMFPRVIYENPPIFKAGFPIDYVPGSVSERFKDEERVWIIRQIDGSFIALIAICTHLGCTPRWLSSENKFKCPCHGSGFRGNPLYGMHFEGPAPRPLERCSISLSPDGQLLIDKSKKFLWENGDWDKSESSLKV